MPVAPNSTCASERLLRPRRVEARTRVGGINFPGVARYCWGDPVNWIDPSGEIPDSIRLKVLARMAAGDIAGAGEYYLLATGASQLPRWFTAMQQAFTAANQVAGRCEGVANTIAEGFRKLGQNPQIVKVFSDKGQFLSWHGRQMVSNNNFRVAVMNGGKIYDAYTGLPE